MHYFTQSPTHSVTQSQMRSTGKQWRCLLFNCITLCESGKLPVKWEHDVNDAIALAIALATHPSTTDMVALVLTKYDCLLIIHRKCSVHKHTHSIHGDPICSRYNSNGRC